VKSRLKKLRFVVFFNWKTKKYEYYKKKDLEKLDGQAEGEDSDEE